MQLLHIRVFWVVAKLLLCSCYLLGWLPRCCYALLHIKVFWVVAKVLGCYGWFLGYCSGILVG